MVLRSFLRGNAITNGWVNGQTNINITMLEDAELLDEVVVVVTVPWIEGK